MLLDGALAAIAAAHAAMERGEIVAKGRAIARAASIVEEGLRGMLDMQAGGEVAKTLYDLYTCVLVRLTQAHAANDRAVLRECSDLLGPLRESWNAIKPQRIAA
jgi:flagellar protein FliS